LGDLRRGGVIDRRHNRGRFLRECGLAHWVDINPPGPSFLDYEEYHAYSNKKQKQSGSYLFEFHFHVTSSGLN
jgi:hypothetical protein